MRRYPTVYCHSIHTPNSLPNLEPFIQPCFQPRPPGRQFSRLFYLRWQFLFLYPGHRFGQGFWDIVRLLQLGQCFRLCACSISSYDVELMAVSFLFITKILRKLRLLFPPSGCVKAEETHNFFDGGEVPFGKGRRRHI